MPRNTKNESIGAVTAPVEFCILYISLAMFSSEQTNAPMTTSECPPRYFVTECITTSAPKSNGFCKYGVAKVLSTHNIAPADFEIFAIASMSTIFIIGFVGVSTQIILVFSFTKAATASTSCILTKWNMMPYFSKIVLKIR